MSQEIIDLPPTEWRFVERSPTPKTDPWKIAENFIVWAVSAVVLYFAAVGLQSMVYPPKAPTCGITSTGVKWCLKDER
jgi:hypothetical protein